MELSLGVIVDMHGRSPRPILEEFSSRKVDAILVGGDIRGYDGKFFPVLDELGTTSIPTYLIPGSHDYKSEWKAVKSCKNLIDLHSKNAPVQVGEYDLIGLSGSFTIPASVPESEAFGRFPADRSMDMRNVDTNRDYILLAHDPPLGYGDVAWFIQTDRQTRIPATAALDAGMPLDQVKQYGQIAHVGDPGLRWWVDGIGIIPPVFTLCGHVHESYQFAPMGSDPVAGRVWPEGKWAGNGCLNPGPWMEGKAAIVHLEKDRVSYRSVQK